MQSFNYSVNAIASIVKLSCYGLDCMAVLFVNIFRAQMGGTMDVTMKNNSVKRRDRFWTNCSFMPKSGYFDALVDIEGFLRD